MPASSIRSYLRLNTPAVFARMERAQYVLQGFEPHSGSSPKPAAAAAATSATASGRDGATFRIGRSAMVLDDCNAWLERQPPHSLHGVVTDPPYGLVEYSAVEQAKLRGGTGGGIWRIPPSFDGSKRSPLPRFTVLSAADLHDLERFFHSWGRRLMTVLVPGANVVMASNPLLSYIVSGALARAGLERRGELVRLTMTMRVVTDPRPRMSSSRM